MTRENTMYAQNIQIGEVIKFEGKDIFELEVVLIKETKCYMTLTSVEGTTKRVKKDKKVKKVIPNKGYKLVKPNKIKKGDIVSCFNDINCEDKEVSMVLEEKGLVHLYFTDGTQDWYFPDKYHLEVKIEAETDEISKEFNELMDILSDESEAIAKEESKETQIVEDEVIKPTSEIKINAIADKKATDIEVGEYVYYGGSLGKVLHIELIHWNVIMFHLDSEIFKTIEVSTTDTIRVITNGSFPVEAKSVAIGDYILLEDKVVKVLEIEIPEKDCLSLSIYYNESYNSLYPTAKKFDPDELVTVVIPEIKRTKMPDLKVGDIVSKKTGNEVITNISKNEDKYTLIFGNEHYYIYPKHDTLNVVILPSKIH